LVKLRSGDVVQTGYVKTGGSYCSQSQLELTFGLGKMNLVDAVEIHWPSGKKQDLTRLQANQLVTIHEVEGLVTP
jgi:hypothetical protein